jgi:hypothetical protein
MVHEDEKDDLSIEVIRQELLTGLNNLQTDEYEITNSLLLRLKFLATIDIKISSNNQPVVSTYVTLGGKIVVRTLSDMTAEGVVNDFHIGGKLQFLYMYIYTYICVWKFVSVFIYTYKDITHAVCGSYSLYFIHVYVYSYVNI